MSPLPPDSEATSDGGKVPEVGDHKSDPPPSDFGATRDNDHGKDEPGETQGGEEAAA